MAGETLSRDVALNVVGKIAGYQKELEKLPGVTQKMAARSALAMQKAFTNQVIDDFKEAEKAAAASAGRMEAIFSGVAENLGTEAIKGLVSSALGAKSEVAALTGEMATFARATGLSLETVNALRFAMEVNGRTFSELSQTLENYPERMEQFRLGSGEGLQVMEALGFKVKDADALIADMGGTLEEVLRRLQEVDNDAHRAALMTSMFGDAALYLSAALGDVPLEEWARRAEVGVEVSERAVAANKDWVSTLEVTSEALGKFKQELVDVVDLTGLVRFLGQAFVVVGKVATGAIDETLSRMAWLVAAVRMLARGDLTSAREAFEEWGKGGIKATMQGVIDDAVLAGREFGRVADAMNDVSTASDGLNRKLGKTTQELDKAKQQAKAYETELERLRKQKQEMGDLWLDVASDQVSAESKVRLEAVKRNEQAAALVREGVMLWSQFREFRVANQERENREIKALLDEQRMDSEAFARETQQTIIDNQKATAEFTKELWSDWGSQVYGQLTEAASTFFGMLGDMRDRDLDKAQKARDREQEQLDELYAQRAEVTTKQQLAEIDATIATQRARVAAAQDEVTQRRAAAQRLAAWQKGQALFEVGINTASAVMKAFAMFGPPPSPIGIGAAAAAGVLGLAQVGAVAAQPLPTFFGGTSRIPGSGSGEVPVIAHEGESMLNRRATDNLGPQIIDALNAGLSLAALRGGGGGGDVYLDGRRVGMVQDRARRLNSRKPTGFHPVGGRR